jgi:hypothetical protein
MVMVGYIYIELIFKKDNCMVFFSPNFQFRRATALSLIFIHSYPPPDSPLLSRPDSPCSMVNKFRFKINRFQTSVGVWRKKEKKQDD